jgi:hypothetical protein
MNLKFKQRAKLNKFELIMSSKHKNTDISPKNRKKSNCAFNDNWLSDNNYKQWIKKCMTIR